MSLIIMPLRESHLEDAAGLFCSGFRTLFKDVPALPAKYSQINGILPLLQDILQKSPGVAAIRRGKLVGFLVGFLLSEFMGQRSMYSPEWANGAHSNGRHLIYDQMYERLSAEWISQGCFTHVVTLLANNKAGMNTWNWLGFGMAAVDGVRELKPINKSVTASGLDIRKASIEDLRTAQIFEDALEQHLAAPPIFWPHERQNYAEWLQVPANTLWLAYDGKEAVGAMALEPGHPDGCQVTQHEKTTSITSAFTNQQSRGKGIGATLLAKCLEYAASQGFERCAVDFEPMNYLATRFWLSHFDPVCYSLMRHIDERISSTQAQTSLNEFKKY